MGITTALDHRANSRALTRRSFVGAAGIAAGALATAGFPTLDEARATEADAPAETLADGTYTSTQTGMGGAFDITMTVADGKIATIEAGENAETLMVGSEAIRILAQRIVDSQSLGVDVVAGATYTSYAMLSGVEDCVSQAGGNIDALKAVEVRVDTYDELPHEADTIIVGGGLAGIMAAIAAVEAGGNVILLERKEYLGGNSVLSTGTFLMGGTSIQKALGIEDDPDTFYNWILENSDYAKDPVQSSWVAYNSQNLIDFLAQRGVNFNEKKVNNTDGSDIPRGHALSPNIGTAVTELVAHMEKIGVDVRYATTVTGLLQEGGEVVGVSATDYYGNPVEYRGTRIVLAPGGWGDNPAMITENWGAEYEGLVYGGAVGMDGALLNAAVALGADTVDMDDPHIDATLEVTRHITITTNVLRSCGGILIRQSTGTRFADEQAEHSEIAAAAMHDLGDEYFYEIFDDRAWDYSEAVATKLSSYVAMGLTQKFDSIEAMAKGLDVDAKALQTTMDTYNAAVRGEAADEFGRERFWEELQAPFYVMKVANGVACTTGGLRINENMQVVNAEEQPISAGLYALGEIVGGYLIHYVGGDSLARSAITGMLLGEQLGA